MAKPKKPSVALVTCDDGDWEGFFYNGKLIREGHSIQATDILDFLEDQDILHFESYEAKLDPYKHSSFEKTLEKNAAAGIIDEPRPR